MSGNSLKILGFNDLCKLQKYLQSWTQYLKLTKETKQNWAGAEIFGNYFCLTFDCYYNCFFVEGSPDTRIYCIQNVFFHNIFQFPKILSLKSFGNSFSLLVHSWRIWSTTWLVVNRNISNSSKIFSQDFRLYDLYKLQKS